MKPDKERLKELKFEYMKLYQNGYIKLPLLDDLLALIDSALAEPDADVAEAIDVMTQMLKFMDGTIPADAMSNYRNERKAYQTAINALRQYQKPTGETSDGYHTFNELYHHRAILFSALSKAFPDKSWKSLKHHDGTMFDDETFICGIETPKGHYTYHYNTRYWPMFAGKILDNAPEWDGHKPEDVERLMSLQGYQKPTDEAVQRAIEWMKNIAEHAEVILDEVKTKEPHVSPMLYERRSELAKVCIAALRQMGSTKHSTDSTRATGCEICGNFKRVDCRADNLEFTAVYCPNCGRPLKGGE